MNCFLTYSAYSAITAAVLCIAVGLLFVISRPPHVKSYFECTVKQAETVAGANAVLRSMFFNRKKE